MSISERLKLVCQEKNWKLKDFSEATGLPYRTAQGYLNGTREPNAEGIFVIHSTLNVNLNWLLSGNGDIFLDLDDEISSDELYFIKKLRCCNELGKKIITLNLNSILNDELFLEVNHNDS